MSLSQFSLAGKTALVTGASSGIGFGVARGLARAGARVVAAARRIEALETLVAEIETEGGEAIAVRLDVTDKDSIAAALTRAETVFGVVDIIVNNAGVADPKPFLKTDDDSLDFVMDTNFKGVWHVAQLAAQRMADNNINGSIINIASVLALGVHSGYSSYSASKAAVMQLTKNMAIDLGRHNIRVNAIAPGWFITELNEDFLATDEGQTYLKQTPARRAGDIEELVGPIILLASEAGSFINGAVLPVDGAHSVVLV